jgi:hypothetical protein
MGRGGVTFAGEWAACERRLLLCCVAAVEEYLGATLRTPWAFEKTVGGGFRLTQASLLVTGARAATLGALVGTVKVAAEFAAPLTDFGEWKGS